MQIRTGPRQHLASRIAPRHRQNALHGCLHRQYIRFHRIRHFHASHSLSTVQFWEAVRSLTSMTAPEETHLMNRKCGNNGSCVKRTCIAWFLTEPMNTKHRNDASCGNAPYVRSCAERFKRRGIDLVDSC